jgi:hypothetical protein
VVDAVDEIVCWYLLGCEVFRSEVIATLDCQKVRYQLLVKLSRCNM